MIEQRERQPLDPESYTYSAEAEVVQAMGQDEHQGRTFVFLENCGKDLDYAQSVLEKRRETSVSPLDIFVLDTGIDEEKSDAQRMAVRNQEIGLWAGAPIMIEILLNNTVGVQG